jgi:glutathione synthase/RimK-type ligase-like ATP-grasp enzyme
VLDLAETVPYLPRLGWDVLPTDDGFVVLEANAHAATRTVQVHRPLLRDERVRRFYEHHDCL